MRVKGMFHVLTRSFAVMAAMVAMHRSDLPNAANACAVCKSNTLCEWYEYGWTVCAVKETSEGSTCTVSGYVCGGGGGGGS
jgi:hypothetical protein